MSESGINQLEELTKLVNKAITSINIGSDLPLEVEIAENLIKYGVIVTPCMAMVEQFIKDGNFDRKRTAHNGRIAVVYIDKNKCGMPLIDITEQFYNVDKAVDRIKALKGGATNE